MSAAYHHRPIFEGQLKNEKIQFTYVKHWITDVPEIIAIMLLYTAPLLVLMYYTPYMHSSLRTFAWFFGSLYFIFFGLALYIHWLNDFFDLFILTDKRIIDITQERFLARKTTIAELNQIQHASYRQKGVLDYILNVGVVDVQTAGANPDLRMSYIKRPAKVTDQILSYSRNYRKNAASQSAQPIAVVRNTAQNS